MRIQSLKTDQLESLDWGVLGSYSSWAYKPLPDRNSCGILSYRDCLRYQEHYHIEGAKQSLLLSLKALPWDSAFFGLRMGQLQLLGDIEHTEVRRECLEVLHELLRVSPIEHWHLEINADNWQSLNDLLRMNFHLVDTKLSFINSHPQPPSRKSPLASRCRPYQSADSETVSAMAYNHAIASRFQRDPLLCSRAAQLYELWVQRLLPKDPTQTTINPCCVYHKNQMPTAFGTLETLHLPGDLTGQRYYANGLVLTQQNTHGVYYPIIHQLHTQISQQPYLYSEIRISQSLLPAYRVLHRFARLRAIHHSLHWHKNPA